MSNVNLLRFITKAKEVHGDKYDYSLVEYKDNKTKVKIICPVHGIFEQTPANHYRHSCKLCNIASNKTNYKGKKNRGSNGVRLDNESIIQQFVAIHGEKYDYSLVEYKNKKTKVKIICPVHGVFEQLPHNHAVGKGCRLCFIEKERFTRDQLVGEFTKVHKDKYNYSLFVDYINIDSKVLIICPKHGVFEQSAYDHKKGVGCPLCSNRVSKPESEVYEYLASIYKGLIIRNSRKIIEGFELDLYIPEHKLAIEYNGLYRHSEQTLRTRGIDAKRYHYNKLNLCEKQDIKLITIFDDEWIQRPEVIKSKLAYEVKQNFTSIYARKCSVVEVSSKVKNELMDRWHLQGKDSCKYSYGLVYENEIVALLTMAKPSVSGGNKEYEWNISRFACKPYVNVVGGFSKLMKYFVKQANPISILTYADRRWSQGNLYINYGFNKLGATDPNYWYIKGRTRKHRFGYRKHELPKILKIYNQSKTEYQNMIDNLSNGTGLDRIWDCGNLAFGLKLK